MDIFASKLVNVVSLAAAAAVIITGCCAVLLVTCLARRTMPDSTVKRLVGIWASVVLPLLLLSGGSMLLLHCSAWHKFNSIMAQKPNRLIITSEGKTNHIDDPLLIVEFYRVVTLSQKVSAHHSHAVSDVKLLFPQSGYIYSLGRDSQYSNEFWFGWSGIGGRTGTGGSLAQLRSDELASWVQKNSP